MNRHIIPHGNDFIVLTDDTKQLLMDTIRDRFDRCDPVWENYKADDLIRLARQLKLHELANQMQCDLNLEHGLL